MEAPFPDARQVTENAEQAVREVGLELARAMSKFGPMASPHEGWAVIREELEELWEHVKKNTGRGLYAREEAIQVAAMALRYAVDLCYGDEAATDESWIGCRVNGGTRTGHKTGVYPLRANATSYDGYVGRCSCGWVSVEQAFAGAALRECQRHEREARRGN